MESTKHLLGELKNEVIKVQTFIAKTRNAHRPIKEGIIAVQLKLLEVLEAYELECARTGATKKCATVTKECATQYEKPTEQWETVAGSKKRVATRTKKPAKGNKIPITVTFADVGAKKVTRPQKTLAFQGSRSTAIIITKKPLICADGTTEKTPVSYAEVLKNVNAATKNVDCGVKSIRRTAKGELIFRLQKSEKKADVFRKIINDVAGPQVEIRQTTSSRIVIIKDIYEGVTAEEVTLALKEKELLQSHVIAMRPAHSGTQTCLVKLPYTPESAALLKEGRVKIGLIRCRVQEWIKLPRCYRCHAFGHIAAKCSGQDRSHLCRQCGQHGHKAITCKNPPMCTVCANKGGDKRASEHICGSSRCGAFRKELARRISVRKKNL